jgi:hypothetical protein
MSGGHYEPDEIDRLIDESEPFGRAYMEGTRTVDRVQGIIEDYNAVCAALEEEFVNDKTRADGDDGYTACMVRLIHQVGSAVRRVENALDRDEYQCLECGACGTARVVDPEVGAVWVEPGCTCENVDSLISAAAMERYRLGKALEG